MRNEKEAVAYAEAIWRMYGNMYLVFQMPTQPCSYGTCLIEERLDYEKSGAIFLSKERQPKYEQVWECSSCFRSFEEEEVNEMEQIHEEDLVFHRHRIESGKSCGPVELMWDNRNV